MAIDDFEYPLKSEKLVQDYIIGSEKLEILTPLHWTRLEYNDTDYLVFPWSVYLISLLFILSCALVAVALIKVRVKKRRKVPLFTWTKLFFNNFYTFFLAHLRQLWCESSMRFLQLIILLSVTFLLAAYDAGFSTKSVSIRYPPTFDTYKSLTSLNQTMIYTRPVQYKLIKDGKFRKTSVEFHLKKTLMKNPYKDINNCSLVMRMKREGKLVIILYRNHKLVTCSQLSYCRALEEEITGLDDNSSHFLIRRSDPDASEDMIQFPISRSILGKPGERRIHWKMRLLIENGLFQKIYSYQQKIEVQAFRAASAIDGMKAVTNAEINCAVDSINPEIQSIDDFRLFELKKLLLVIPFLITFMLFSLVLEALYYKRPKKL